MKNVFTTILGLVEGEDQKIADYTEWFKSCHITTQMVTNLENKGTQLNQSQENKSEDNIKKDNSRDMF